MRNQKTIGLKGEQKTFIRCRIVGVNSIDSSSGRISAIQARFTCKVLFITELQVKKNP